jgi:hypothetical protein
MPELASMAYQVLNAARCWRYVESGELGSKVEGAAWLERRDPDPTQGLLDAALAYQRAAFPISRRADGERVRGAGGGDAPGAVLIYGGKRAVWWRRHTDV